MRQHSWTSAWTSEAAVLAGLTLAAPALSCEYLRCAPDAFDWLVTLMLCGHWSLTSFLQDTHRIFGRGRLNAEAMRSQTTIMSMPVKSMFDRSQTIRCEKRPPHFCHRLSRVSRPPGL